MSEETKTEHSTKRLARTMNHVLRHWIPVDKALLGKIRDGLKRGVYDDDRQTLIKELRSDISLYTWCLKELCEYVRNDGGLEQDFDPIRALEELDSDLLKELLDTDEARFSNHELEFSNPEQVKVLRQVMLGATTADVCSRQVKGDSRAYGVSLLRQLGLTLIAWNYPSVFEECLVSVRNGGDLDIEITQRLGFSPGLLAMKLVREWGVSAKKCLSLGLMMPSDLSAFMEEEIEAEAGESTDFFLQVCELGERLARANEPATYPRKEGEWERIEIEIARTLGANGMVKIREQYEETCAHYSVLLPTIGEASGELFDRRRYPDSKKTEDLLRRNKYLESCTSDVRLILKKFYSDIERLSGANREILRTLVHETIPHCGFQGGVVYTFDPTISKLVPQLRFGLLETLEPVAVDYSLTLRDATVVQQAFQSIDPISRSVRVQSNEINSKSVLAVVGAIGRLRKLGVLYLELPSCLQYGGEGQVVTHFQAIARTLSDCLRV